jgi:CDP-glucose 4,6-dehydratase
MIFKNKNILVTGHTGFKGTWLSLWLSKLGGRIIGVSDKVPTKPAHYELIKDYIDKDYRIDIRDLESLKNIIIEEVPDIIFHLAAQPIVIKSYESPIETFSINAMGTANILESIRKIEHKCLVIMITSDKCYDNVEKNFGYLETDRLGGKDPYSGSKGAAELIIRSYVKSFFNDENCNIKLSIGRAGNVIGGGDWAQHRIIPDCIRSWSKNKKPEIRNPHATRPWQHVLEPLSGYLTLAVKLEQNKVLNGDAFNFGPNEGEDHTVKEVVDELTYHWPGSGWIDTSQNNLAPHEAGLLKLNCEKAFKTLDWKATLNFKETSHWTAEWYRTYYDKGSEKALQLTSDQIDNYMKIAKDRNSFRLI